MSVWTKIEALKDKPGWNEKAISKACGKRSHSWLSNVRTGYAGMKAKDAEALVRLLAAHDLIESEEDRKTCILELLAVHSIRPAETPDAATANFCAAVGG